MERLNGVRPAFPARVVQFLDNARGQLRTTPQFRVAEFKSDGLYKQLLFAN